jgi:RNA polymerase sigma-70 factor (ECF subfamily)
VFQGAPVWSSVGQSGVVDGRNPRNETPQMGERGQQSGVGATPRLRAVPSPVADLESVYRAHADFVWRVVRRLGVDDGAAEDVVHEVFLVVQRRLPDFDGRAAMSSWLYGIARGVVANHKRGTSREHRRLQLVVPAAPPRDPEELSRRRQAAETVRVFLSSLGEEQREVFTLVEIEGLKGPEAAAALGIDVNLLYSRLRGARDRFRSFCQNRKESS